MNLSKVCLLCLAFLSMYFTALPGHATCSDSSGCYGSGLGSDGLANTVIGVQWGNIVSYRFRAGHSGALQQIHVYLIQNHVGYSFGTGGQIQVTVNADDGTSAHNPSSTVLATYLLSNPLAATPSIYFPIFVFSAPPTLVQGQLYHIVFTNVDPNPVSNYLSIDALYYANPSTPAQPTISDLDFAELLGDPSGSWTPRKGYTPILQLDYQDGWTELNGYMEVWVGVPQNISGTSQVRETITVTGAQKTVSSASIRVARTSGTDPLIVRLENGDGTVIEQGEIPAASIPVSSYAWATVNFSAGHTLLAGQTYHLQLGAASTSTYQAYPIRKGVAYGFQNTTYFPDGYAQFNQGGSWVGWTQWGVTNRTDGDLQFYFNLAPANTAAPTISNVAAGSLASDGATITWTTDQPSTSQVEYGTTIAYGNLTTVDASSVTSHSVVLTGLAASTLYHYRVHSVNSSGVEGISGDLTFTTLGPSLNVATTSLPDATQNIAYSATLVASGGTTPYSWSVISGTLPAGLTLASATGVISGTPTGSGTSSFTVQVSDANSMTATKPLTLTVTATPAPTITTASLPGGTQNVAYSATLAATGGTTPYTWSTISGTLPAGLTLALNGVISGTPTGSGTSSFTVQVTDANSMTATKPLTLTVTATPAPTITTTTLPGGTQNIAYSATLAATGGTTPYTWSTISGTLPAGLTLAPNGVISGTPTGSGTSSFTVQVTDATAKTASKALSLTVTAAIAPPTVITTTLPSGTQNAAYSATLAATGGTPPYNWSILSGTLPAGLTLAPNGVISGTPTGSGTSSFTVQVTDAGSRIASKALGITITGSSGGGGIGLVQANAGQGSFVSSVSVAFPTATKPGNLIIVFVRSKESQTATLTDSAGNTYVQAVSQVQNSDGTQLRLYYARNILGGVNTVKATITTTSYHLWLAVYEYKGLSTTSPLDQTSSAQGRSAAPTTGATPTTTSANELIFAGFGFPSPTSASQSAGTGYTLLQRDRTGAGATESKLVTSTGSYTATFNLGSSVNWSAVVATFK